ncbi:MAG TPA: CDGSH iron-sulfur domain-containing protein [Bacillales bacterium]|nr:CDGSH iron-sulfur domain-containing protein [Bacillales bacterium]
MELEVFIIAEVKFLDNGPIVATGVTLVDGEGNQLDSKAEVYLCRCGLSKNKPFCDGAHKEQFESIVRA